jgi:hypothetical protein
MTGIALGRARLCTRSNARARRQRGSAPHTLAAFPVPTLPVKNTPALTLAKNVVRAVADEAELTFRDG